MEKNFGIFIRSEDQGKRDFLIEQCQGLLKRVKSEATIKYIKSDNIRGGFTVRFDRDVSESQLLKKRYLCDDASATVHSLTTSLVVRDAYPDDEVDFVEDVRKQLGKIWEKKVLEVKKIPPSEKYPHIGTGKYVVILQVPEVEDLEEFKAMGLPDDMVLELPSCDEKLKVKFYCRRCLKEGHVQTSCPSQLDNHVSTTVINQPSKRPLQDGEVSNPKPKKKKSPGFEVNGIGECRDEVSIGDVYPDLQCVINFQENSGEGKTDPPPSNSKEFQSTTSAEYFSNQTTNPIMKNTSLPSDIIIPIGIREIMYCLPNPVSDVNALQNFFNQVKKRPNVTEIAKQFNYTNDIEELRQQLKDTVKKYYQPPITGSLEDKKFVKWIEKFLKRF